MSAKTDRRYASKPTLKRDDEDGKMKVKKTEKVKADDVEAGTEGVVREGEAIPHEARHAMERRDMFNRHENEHTIHDHGKHGDKTDMHERHAKEHHKMLKRHAKEMAKGEAKTGEAEIEKVEEAAKE